MATVTFTVTSKEVRIWDVEADDWAVVDGTYGAFVGSSSRDIRQKTTIEVSSQ